MSETIGHMAKLDMRKAEDDRLYWVDTENGGTIPEEEALKSLGIDPEEHQEPAEAVWHRQDTGEELEVKIIGIFARNNEKKEDYLQAEGMTVGIPRSELTFKKQETQEDPEIAELREAVKRLTAQVAQLERKNAELEAKLEGKKPPVPEPEEYGGFKKEDEVGIRSGDKYAVGYNVKGFTEPDEEGKRKVIIQKKGQPEQEVNPADLKKLEEIDDEIEDSDSQEPAEYAGFSKDDKVGVKFGEKYVVGYEVIGFTEPDAQGRRKIRIRQENGEEERIVSPLALKKRHEIQDDEIAGETTPPPEKERRSRIIEAAVALGGLVLAGFIGYELGKHGHNMDVTKLQREVNDIDQQLNIFEARDTAQHIHDHQHELQAIRGLHNQISRDHTQEMKAIHDLGSQLKGGAGLHERARDTGMYWGLRYPWDWAANKVGAYRAEGWLHTLAARAAQHGHSIRWLAGGHGTEILRVDGKTDTGYVVDVLKQYGQ